MRRLGPLVFIVVAALAPLGCGRPDPAGSTGSTSGDATSGTGTSGSTGDCGSGCLRCGDTCSCQPGIRCPVDAGPFDGGVYTYDAGPNRYWCRVVVDGGLVGTDADDAGCITPLPACAGTSIPLEPEVHVPEPMTVAYIAQPPASGPHWPCWAPWGVLHAHAALPTERWLHNSEHAGVVLLYRCDPGAGLPDGGSCDAMAAPLIAYAQDGGPLAPDGDARYLVTADPNLPTSYTAIAWGWRLEFDAWDPERVSCFARAHLGAGPEELYQDPDPNSCPQSYAP